MKGLRKFIGDKQFYKHVFSIIIPIMLQQLLVSVAGYVDGLMINSYGGEGYVEAYNGVSAANRLMFILNFVWMALAATASIFIAQYYGAKNTKKVNEAVRLSVYVAIGVGILSFFVIEFFGDSIVNMFLTNAEGRQFGYRYLDAIKWGTVITSLTIALGSAFRSVKQTVIPLVSAILGIITNVVLNYCLIFGHFGFPELDSMGAAVATVVSKLVELIILIIIMFTSKHSCFKDLFKEWGVTKELNAQYVKKGTPLVCNEILWSTSITLFAMFYAWKNDVWYNAYAYSQNITDLFFIMFAGLGNGTAIIIGSCLGAGDFEAAKINADRMKGLGVMMGLFFGGLMALTSPLIVEMFRPDAYTRQLTLSVLYITAVFIAVYGYNSVCFFILRAGGDSVRAFILDQLPTYIISIPIAAFFGINAKNFGLSLTHVFLFSHACDIIKLFVSTSFVNKGKWIVNLAKNPEAIDAEQETLEMTDSVA